MKRFAHIARLLVVVTPLLVLIPVGRIVMDWVEVSRVISSSAVTASPRGYDWVLWQEHDGLITAAYVFPRGPAARAGIQQGDVFFQLDYQQYFNAEDLRHAIEGMQPGQASYYSVLRDGRFIEAYVELTRYPTFLYPLSGALWSFALWGFTLAAFLHLLGPFIVGPLALRSRKAQFSLLLILVSSLWIFSNLLRLLMITLTGPPSTAGGTAAQIFQGLTLAGLAGWIGFPALLLRKVLGDTRLTRPGGLGRIHLLIYLPPVLLGLAVIVTTLGDHLGPLTQDDLIAPLLFYACLYIAAAAALVLAFYTQCRSDAEELLSGWSREGSLATLGIALLAALFVLGIVPILGAVTDAAAGWLIVSTQLLTVAPVSLVSVATLKHGKVDLVLSRGLTYLTVLGLIFFAFVGGLSLIDPYLERAGDSRNVITGLYVVLLLIVFERLARRVRLYAAGFFVTERQRKQKALSHLQEQMRALLNLESLLHQTVQTVGTTFQARSAVLFLRRQGPSGPWLSCTYHPEPPYLTERALSLVWPHIQQEKRIWAQNPELNESSLPERLAELLEQRGAVVAIPIRGDDVPMGLLVLGPKKRRGAVYNLEDIDLLRALSGQLALAVERLNLVEREKALIRESAEAQLVALRAQINPHFLFNALNTIVALIEERPEEAEETVEHLAAIFRHILQTGSRLFVSMQNEFALIAHYLGIEQARFGQKLEVEQRLDSALVSYPVPAFVVQTLVENAVKHGIEKRRGGGRICILCEPTEDGWAKVTVSDTGVGIPALYGRDEHTVPDTSFFGIGLRNVTARLEQLFGRSDLLQIRSTPEAGTTVHLLLPPQPAGTHAGDGVPDATAAVRDR